MIAIFDHNEFNRDLVAWCKHHFDENLVALGLFDPSKVNEKYPCGDINILIVLNMAPENERERYDIVTEMLVQNLAPKKTLICRVQTMGELHVLSNLQLPLIDIYLSDIEILHDPRKFLENERNALFSNSDKQDTE
jgi:hypothetical protein